MSSLFRSLGALFRPAVAGTGRLWQAMTATEDEWLATEARWGAELAKALREDLPAEQAPAPDPALDRVAAALVDCLADRLRRRKLAFQTVGKPELNAFAFPGGYVFVTRLLLDLTAGDDGQVAFLLGHEMGHVVRAHIRQRMTDEFVSGILVRATIGGGLLQKSVAALTERLVESAYSQDQEFEADQFAVKLARAAQFDPEGGIRLLELLKRCGADRRPFGKHLSSHPPIDERIAAIRAFLKRPA